MDLDRAIAEEEVRLEKLKKLWELKRESAALELRCAGLSCTVAVVRDLVVDVVCRQFEVSREELFGRSKPDRLVWPRYLAMQLYQQLTFASQPEVGRIFSRDHASVCNALAQIKNRSQADPVFAARRCRVEAEIYGALIERFDRARCKEVNGEH